MTYKNEVSKNGFFSQADNNQGVTVATVTAQVLVPLKLLIEKVNIAVSLNTKNKDDNLNVLDNLTSCAKHVEKTLNGPEIKANATPSESMDVMDVRPMKSH